MKKYEKLCLNKGCNNAGELEKIKIINKWYSGLKVSSVENPHSL